MSVDMKNLEEKFLAERHACNEPVQTDNHTEFYRKYNGMKINILGSEWTIRVVDPYNKRMEVNECTGLCEAYSKEIYVRDRTALDDPKQYLNIEGFVKKVLRHEIIHAVFFETGRADYYEDENLTEVLAHLVPKMAKIMLELDLM